MTEETTVSHHQNNFVKEVGTLKGDHLLYLRETTDMFLESAKPVLALVRTLF